MPDDNSVIKISKRYTGPRLMDEKYREEFKTSRYSNFILKDDLVFGARKVENDSEIWLH